MRPTCHEHGEQCWFAAIDDRECWGRLATYLMEEVRYGGAVRV
ncbi:hypothetical protein ACIBH1_01310 [Nonomuraea sp. NPDC050663]|uniref:Uncharacterized protein n=1 Tax=Nonomuraea soli TaxID=1032476 RepID=A0A7W0CTS5_9ACTN|nr:hypothetical protein [Nonomuraea soli]MBA2897208.1 hypothetical protein [Nonomuraea soli]